MSPKGRLRSRRIHFQLKLEASRRLKQRFLRNDPIVSLRRYIGKPCPYCDDIMTDGMASLKRPTKDHIIPKRLRQTPEDKYRYVICCHECNQLKGDMSQYDFCVWLYRRKNYGIRDWGRVECSMQQESVTVHCVSSL